MACDNLYQLARKLGRKGGYAPLAVGVDYLGMRPREDVYRIGTSATLYADKLGFLTAHHIGGFKRLATRFDAAYEDKRNL